MILRRNLHLVSLAAALVCANFARATTFYVSPSGSDNNSGTSPGSAWQSLTKVDNTTFTPGSQILLQSGGNWYGSQLIASSDGTASQPITYGSYGSGASPTIWGSVPVSASSLQPVANYTNTYFYPSARPVNDFFINHQFMHNAQTVTGVNNESSLISYVEAVPNTYYDDVNGSTPGVYVNLGQSANTYNTTYSAAVVEDAISSNAHSNLIFQNLAVKETAHADAGYGVRIENSSNVQVLNTSISAAGKHAVGVIDSTGFVGSNLTTNYLMPDQGFGGATAYVAYSDFNVANTTSQWLNDSFTNPNGSYQAFITHSTPNATNSTPISSVVIKNMYANINPAITIQNAGTGTTLISGGQFGGEVELQGNNTTIDGALITGPDSFLTIEGGSGNVIQNTIINGAVPNWTANRDGAIIDSGYNNTIRDNTINLGPGTGLYEAAIALEYNGTNTQIYGNIINSQYAAFFQRNGGTPLINAHDNLFSGYATPEIIYLNRSPGDSPVANWPATISSNELFGDPSFVDAADGNFTLQPGSIAAYVFNPASNEYVLTDYAGATRPTILDSLGAIQIAASGTTATSWNVDGNGKWETAANWSSGSVPNAVDAIAMLGATITAPRTVSVTAAQTVGTLYFSSPVSYTLTGNGSVNLSVSAGTAAIDVSAGNHSISVPLILSSPTAANIGVGSVLTFTGHVTGTAALTENGGGSLLITTTAVVGVPLVSNGSVTFASNGNTSGFLVQTIPYLTLGARGTVTLADPGAANRSNRTLLVAGGLSFIGNGVLDLTRNDLDVQNGNLAQLTQELAQGYNATNGGYWDGLGIVSSVAATDTRHLTTLGIIQNSTNGLPTGTALYSNSVGGRGPFDSFAALNTDVLIKYTYFGDANLDGKVDGSDYTRIDAGMLSHATGWSNGDFNYDGVVDGSDYTLIDNAFNTQSASLAAVVSPTVQISSEIASVSAVPEPASLMLFGAGIATTALRRRK